MIVSPWTRNMRDKIRMQRLPLRRDECARWRFILQSFAAGIAIFGTERIAGAFAECVVHG
jgi:hypothetical protein